MIEVSPLTAADLIEYYGQLPQESIRGFKVRCDGEIFGVIGVARRPDHLMLFSDYKPAYKDQLRRVATLRAIYAAMALVDELTSAGCPVYALANPEEPDSQRLLSRLGFEHLGSSANGELYVCHS